MGVCVRRERVVGTENGRDGRESRVEVGREETLPLGQPHAGGHLLLPLGPPVLEPRLDLRLRQVKRLRQLQALRHAQVLVHLRRENREL